MHAILLSVDFYEIKFQDSFRITIRVSNSLNPGQARKTFEPLIINIVSVGANEV